MAHTLHIVPHTHWDREWYQPFQLFRLRLVHLMDRLLTLLAQEPTDLAFTLDGQVILLEDYLAVRPEQEEAIRAHVEAGRLLIGPWYVLPDEFLVGPEAILRNLERGARLAHAFGGGMPVGYIPDPFGHIGQMPQILQGFGIRWAALRRGLDDEPTELWWEAPDGSRVLLSYLRDGYDNAARLPTEPRAFVQRLTELRDSLAPHSRSAHLLLLNGTDHQEPQPELPLLIAAVQEGIPDRVLLSTLPRYFQAMEEALGDEGLAELPVVRGELRSPKRHHLLPGVLSTRIWIKQRNHALETLLTRWAEPLAAWAELLDPGDLQPVILTGNVPLPRLRHPAPLLDEAWRLLLQNHPHDSICGCSVDQVHREMVPRFDQAEQIAGEITRQSMLTIASQIEMGGNHQRMPIVVFNPLDGPRTDAVTVTVSLADRFRCFQVVDAQGQVVPHQMGNPAEPHPLLDMRVDRQGLIGAMAFVQEGRIMGLPIREVRGRREGVQATITIALLEEGLPDPEAVEQGLAQVQALLADESVEQYRVIGYLAPTQEITFVARDLPSYGYATYFLDPSEEEVAGKPLKPPPPPDGGERWAIENELLRVEVGPEDGTLTVVDKRTGQVYAGLHRFVDGGDRGDSYTFCPPEEDTVVDRPAGPPEVHLLEAGPARWTLEVRQRYLLPDALEADRRRRTATRTPVPIVSRIRLVAGLPRVDVETTVDNRVRDHRLQVHFPVPITVERAFFDGHFQVVERPLVLPRETEGWAEQPVPEQPQRAFTTVSDGEVGLTVANRGLPEVAVLPGEGGTTIALTLLRSVGWLSRDDFPCRRGKAGPGLPLPEAQCLGRYTFHYSIIPHAGGWETVYPLAYAFEVPPRGIVIGAPNRSNGEVRPLPLRASLVQVEWEPQEPGSAFLLTAIRQSADGPGLLVRGYNIGAVPLDVTLTPWWPFRRAWRVRLDGELLEELPVAGDHSVRLAVKGHQIATVRFED